MANKDDKCYFCDRLAVDTKLVIVDAEAVHDGDEWTMMPLKSFVGLCQDHLEAYENGELYDY